MAYDYTRARKTAQRQLSKFGQPATLKRAVVGGSSGIYEFDPHPVAAETQSYPLTVLELNAQIAARRDQAISAKHQLMVAPEAPVTPEETDRIELRGVEYGIAEVRAVAPGGLLIYWELDLAE